MLSWAELSASPERCVLPWQQASAPRGWRARHSLESRTGSVGVRVHSARLAGRAPDNRGALCSSRGWLIGPGLLLGLLSKPLVSVLSRHKRCAFQVTWRQKGFRSQLGGGAPGEFRGKCQGPSSRKASGPQGWVPDSPRSPSETHSDAGIPQ